MDPRATKRSKSQANFKKLLQLSRYDLILSGLEERGLYTVTKGLSKRDRNNLDVALIQILQSCAIPNARKFINFWIELTNKIEELAWKPENTFQYISIAEEEYKTAKQNLAAIEEVLRIKPLPTSKKGETLQITATTKRNLENFSAYYKDRIITYSNLFRNFQRSGPDYVLNKSNARCIDECLLLVEKHLKKSPPDMMVLSPHKLNGQSRPSKKVLHKTSSPRLIMNILDTFRIFPTYNEDALRMRLKRRKSPRPL